MGEIEEIVKSHQFVTHTESNLSLSSTAIFSLFSQNPLLWLERIRRFRRYLRFPKKLSFITVPSNRPQDAMSDAGGSLLVAPKVLKPIGGQLGVPNGVLNIPVSEIGL
jgi:hypothetical protein